MNQDLFPRPNATVNLGSRDSPILFETLVGDINVADGQMNPAHAKRLNLFTQATDIEKCEFTLLNQGHHGAGAPFADDGQIFVQVSVPLVQIFLAGTSSQPKSALAFAEHNLGDLRRRGNAVLQRWQYTHGCTLSRSRLSSSVSPSQR